MVQPYRQSKISAAISLIDCTGPDGKHLQITQQDCEDFNNAWKPTPIPQVVPSYSYSYSSPTYFPIFSNPKLENSTYSIDTGIEDSMQNFHNNLWNAVNTSTLETQMNRTNYQLQEINNALRY